MPLPVDMGEAISDYILNGRAGGSRHLFVTLRAPHRPFRTTRFILSMLVDAIAKAGVTSPKGGVRTHLLRHYLAQILISGCSLRLRQAAESIRDSDGLRSLCPT